MLNYCESNAQAQGRYPVSLTALIPAEQTRISYARVQRELSLRWTILNHVVRELQVSNAFHIYML